eukprot:scaffold67818_cov69-Phaeocystis_antarctica.AAC.5
MHHHPPARPRPVAVVSYACRAGRRTCRPRGGEEPAPPAAVSSEVPAPPAARVTPAAYRHRDRRPPSTPCPAEG